MASQLVCRDGAQRPTQVPVAGIVKNVGFLPAPTRVSMLGIMGRRPAQGSTRRVSTPGKHSLTQLTSGWMRSARMS